jgi:AcrR family transcriptional regulator
MLTLSIYPNIDSVNIVVGKRRTQTRSAKTRPYHHGDLRHALIDAAMALVTEEQDWTFSPLREVARRAGVSHNAPYNHFGEKQDLLIAVAGAGFERLRERMAAAVVGIAAADKALLRRQRCQGCAGRHHRSRCALGRIRRRAGRSSGSGESRILCLVPRARPGDGVA